MVVDRIEVYLDGAAEPLAVLKEPPYRLELDTRTLPDGEHTLRVVTHFRGGGQEVREIPFTVNNYPDILVLGLDEGGEVAGNLELRLAVGEPELPVEPVRFNPVWYAVAAVVVLGGIWGYFALSPAGGTIISQVAPPPAQEAQAGGGQTQASGAAASVDQALLSKGKTVYETHCAACHQANGQGVPGAFPPLAGNPNLKDAQKVLEVIQNGLQGPLTVNGQTYNGQMPAFGQLSQEERVAVATYIRNSWGNSFGPVEAAPAGGTQGAAPAPGAAPTGQAMSPQEAAALAKEGEGLYAQHCAACHQANGQGVPGAFPPLAGNPNLKDKTYHIQVVLNGLQNKPITVNGQTYQGVMPAFGQLSDREIAAILTYERTAWGNNLGPVSEAEVKAAR